MIVITLMIIYVTKTRIDVFRLIEISFLNPHFTEWNYMSDLQLYIVFAQSIVILPRWACLWFNDCSRCIYRRNFGFTF